MPNKRYKIIFTSVLFAVGLIVAIILCGILRFDRAGLINYVIHISGKPYLLMQQHVKTCYDNSTGAGFFYFYPALEYYYSQHSLPVEISMAAPNSLRYKPFQLSDDYDCMIVHVADTTANRTYFPIYTDSTEDFKIVVKQQLIKK